MAIGSILELAIEGNLNGQQQLVNVFHYRQDTLTIFDTPAEDVIEAWVGSVQPEFLAAVNTGCNLVQARSREIAGGGSSMFEADLSGAGTLPGQGLPPQVSACVSWRTGLPGRSNRGRTFMWPATENDQDSGVLSAGYRNLLQAFANGALNIGDGVATAQYTLVVWSQVNQVAVPVTFAKIPVRANTQRRRVLGVGS